MAPKGEKHPKIKPVCLLHSLSFFVRKNFRQLNLPLIEKKLQKVRKVILDILTF